MSDSIPFLARAGVIDENELILAGVFEDWDVYEPATRMYRYRHGNPNFLWRHLDFLFHTASICAFSDPVDANGESYYVALSSEGEVYHHGLTESYTEQIKGAGIYHEESKHYGRMQSIRQIGEKLYACGNGGQIYIRQARDKWELLTKDLLWNSEKSHIARESRPEDLNDLRAQREWRKAFDKEQEESNPNHSLLDINGPSESELYICGEHGILFLWDGETLEDVDPGTENALTNIHVANNGIVWICGREGQLFSGNEEEGFDDHSEEGNGALFTSVTTYKGKVLLASQTDPFGLFEFNPKKDKFKRVKPRVKPALRSIHTIQSVGDVLWLVGGKDILRLENDQWERIQHPDMPVPKL